MARCVVWKDVLAFDNHLTPRQIKDFAAVAQDWVRISDSLRCVRVPRGERTRANHSGTHAHSGPGPTRSSSGTSCPTTW